MKLFISGFKPFSFAAALKSCRPNFFMETETNSTVVETAAPEVNSEPAVETSVPDSSGFENAETSAEPAAGMSRHDAISAALGNSAEAKENVETENQTSDQPDQEEESHDSAEDIEESEPDNSELNEENQLQNFYQQTTILSDEEIDSLRIANTAKAEMKKYAAAARNLEEKLTSVGSEELLEFAVRDFQSLQESAKTGDFYGYLKNIAFSSGFDGLFGLMDEALYRVFAETTNRPADPNEQKLYDATVRIADKNFQSRYGENYTLEKIDRLVRADQQGLVDHDLLTDEEITDVKTSAEYQHLENKYKAVNERLQVLEKNTEKPESSNQPNFENQFSEDLSTALQPVINNPIFQPVKDDSPEIKEIKSALSQAVLLLAKENFRNNANFKDMSSAFGKNLHSLPKTKSDYEAAIRQAYMGTGKFALQAQKIISANYKNSRNVTVKKRLFDNPLDKPGTPTQTTQFQPKPQSEDEARANRRLAIERAVANDKEQFKAYPKVGN